MKRIDLIQASAIALSVLGLLSGLLLLLTLVISPGRLDLASRIWVVGAFLFAAGLLASTVSVLRNRFLRKQSLFERGNACAILAGLTSLIGALWLLQFEGRGIGISAINYCINNQRRIEAAKETWAIRTGATNGAAVNWSDIAGDFFLGLPRCPEGGKYSLGRVGEPVSCSNPEHGNDMSPKVSKN